MSEKFISAWFYASMESTTRPTGLSGSKTETVYDKKTVDLDNYADLLLETYETFDEQGYDVVNVVPISTALSEECTQRGGAYVGDVAFSVTRGAVVIGKKKLP